MNNPLVSVIIPTYNRAGHILHALNSVFAQTYKNYEIIVVDDGSNDETETVLKSYRNRLKYVYQTNAGPAAARNHGVKLAHGDWIAFLDSDDMWLPEKLEKQLGECLRLNADFGFHDLTFKNYITGNHIESWNIHISESSGLPSLETGLIPNLYNRLLFKRAEHLLLLPTFIAKREVFFSVRGFKEELRTSEDIEFFLNLAPRYNAVYVADVLGVCVIHSGPERITSKEKIYVDRMKAIKISLSDRLTCKDFANARIAKLGLAQQMRNLASTYRRSGMTHHALITYARYFMIFLTPLFLLKR